MALRTAAPILQASVDRDFPWGTLRSRFASKVKVVLEEKRLAYRLENLDLEVLAKSLPSSSPPTRSTRCPAAGMARSSSSTRP